MHTKKKKKKKERDGGKRKKRQKQKKRANTHSKDMEIERTKKRDTGRESNIKQRRTTQHRFVYGISPVPFFSISLSLPHS